MQMRDIHSLLEQAFSDGFTVDFINKATGVPADLIRSCNIHQAEKKVVEELESYRRLRRCGRPAVWSDPVPEQRSGSIAFRSDGLCYGTGQQPLCCGYAGGREYPCQLL